MKYRQLAEELKKLTEEQLDQEVLIAREDMPSISLDAVWVAEEDCVDPGEGAEYISSLTDPGIDENPMTEEEVRLEYDVCIKKGAVFLVELVRACRVCGCTDYHACAEGCYWVEADLCSACARKLSSGKTVEEIRSDNLKAQGAPIYNTSIYKR
ncbi:MAG: hypothetical protein ACQ5SW_12350 [Sphaerochaetaceae bacterium]